MVFWLKIDKQSFYHHFFRVIAEVELRNSQEIDALSAYPLASLPAAATVAPRVLSAGILAATIQVLPRLLAIPLRLVWRVLALRQRALRLLPLPRAP
ncbi:MAG: hypothetical protein OHK0039_21960 [Bacteroidia bacterium]